ncbi:MAG: DUF5668 domain-containing protein [Chloroflexi bacterium]|nr:DUF5668 domain-containing protein [Chloroflexota bacterium]
MQVNRGLVFWGVALITAGAVALAVQAGAVGEQPARAIWRAWPAVLIVIGVSVLLARTPFALASTVLAGVVVGGLAGTLAAGWPGAVDLGCGGEPSELVTADGRFADRGDVELDFTCGDLEVSTAGGAEWQLDARHAPGSEPRVTSSDGGLRVEADGGGGFGFGFGFADGRQEWMLVLPTDPTLDLMVDANAASSRLDLAGATFGQLSIDANAGDLRLLLGDATVEELSIDANAGSITIAAGPGGRVDGRVELNAGSMELCVPEDAVVRIALTDDNSTFSHNLEGSGLARSGDSWRRGAGAPDVGLRVEGNAASFTLDPDGGCR